jgi:prepilin-type N-terminal cleavage/methylation domain-containing protein
VFWHYFCYDKHWLNFTNTVLLFLLIMPTNYESNQNPSAQSLNKSGGFSLPEIMIVVLVVAILVVLTLPQSNRQLQLYRLDSSVSLISSKLMEARMEAIKRNRTTWLRLDKTAKTIQIRTTNSSAQTINISSPELFPQGMVLDASDSLEISFDSMGRLTTGTQTFSIRETNSNKRKNITVSPAGKITTGQMY